MKRTFTQVRKDILNVLKDGKEHSYSDLERKADTNWQTVRTHCKDLHMFGAVSIKEGKVKIMKFGMEILKKLG